MKYIIICILFLCTTKNYAQQLKLYNEPIKGGGYNIYANNNELCPVSVKLSYALTNLRVTKGSDIIFVVPPKSNKFLLTDVVRVKKNKKDKISYKYTFNYGDHHLKTHDSNYDYFLPYKKETAYKVHQGYNGSFSHKSKNALDFTMPVGSAIHASRDGIVIKVTDINSKHCGKRECMKYNNFIMVFHPDGTFAEYAHIKKNGAKVKVGDTIKKGQLIALSGNVGYSTGPHLHFVTFLQRIGSRETLKTKFLINDGSKKVFLAEKETYSREY